MASLVGRLDRGSTQTWDLRLGENLAEESHLGVCSEIGCGEHGLGQVT